MRSPTPIALSILLLVLLPGCEKEEDIAPATPTAKAKPAEKKAEAATAEEGAAKPAEPAASAADKAGTDEGQEAPSELILGDEVSAEVAAFMKTHYKGLTAARDAVIAGDLGAYAEHMRALGQIEAPPDLPVGWAPFIKALRHWATGGAGAADIKAAGAAVGVAATVCANCHTASMSSRIIASGEPPPPSDALKSYMQRHAWAMKHMWNGIFGPDDQAWLEAVKVLDATPIHEAPFPEARKLDEVQEALANDVDALATKGLVAKVPQRAVIFGELIATCGTCHANE